MKSTSNARRYIEAFAHRSKKKNPTPAKPSGPKEAPVAANTTPAPQPPSAYAPKNEFTIVTPAYNVESYIDDYFESLLSQTIEKSALHIVLVDDGSTDGTAEAVARWKDTWPGTITYLHEENAGIATARNYGLKHVSTEWVTFVDADDFVSPDYFEQVDRFLKKYSRLQFVATHTMLYREDLPESERISDTHPLGYRFEHGNHYFATDDENRFFHMNANSSFMRMSVIRNEEMRFDARIRPIFEDTHLVSRYMLALENGLIGFLEQPAYYYRKRADGSSLIDVSNEDPCKYTNVMQYGYLDLVHRAMEKYGYVPRWMQDMLLYDISWMIKRFDGHPERSEALACMGVLDSYRSSMRELFTYIDEITINECRYQWLDYNRKYAVGLYFKGHASLDYSNCYLTDVNLEKKLLRIAHASPDLRFSLDGVPVEPIEQKAISQDYLGETWYTRYISLVPYKNKKQVLTLHDRCQKPGINAGGKLFRHRVLLSTAIMHHTQNWDEYKQSGDLWVVMDRNDRADDNAEHFYRWLLRNHPEQDAVFVLSKDSPDWERLEKEGFSLLDYASKQHEDALRRCSTIISAHANVYVHSYFGDNFHHSKRFVFLQHGITKDNISPWLNGKPLSLVITCTPPEQESIAADGSPYALLPSEVALTGFPRHDELLRKSSACNGTPREILIMPTWRNSLVSSTHKNTSADKTASRLFADSAYAKSWGAFLANPRLRGVSQSTGCPVVFSPHPNMEEYIAAGLLVIPDWICVATHKDASSIQNRFARAATCITDYSSAATEVAYLRHPVVYYQFDKNEFYSGSQVYARGYFDFEQDGYGPVAYSEDAAFDALEALAAGGFETPDVYLQRMESDFIYRDGQCCKRVYEAIKNL